LCSLAKAASRYQAGPLAGQMFRKAMHQEGLEPAGLDSDSDQTIQRAVVGFISLNDHSAIF